MEIIHSARTIFVNVNNVFNNERKKCNVLLHINKIVIVMGNLLEIKGCVPPCGYQVSGNVSYLFNVYRYLTDDCL